MILMQYYKSVSSLFVFLFVILFTAKVGATNIEWAKGLGNISTSDMGTFIVTDSNSNSYTLGSFGGTVDFDCGPGVYNVTAIGSNDLFVLKLDSSGNFSWVKSIGGSNYVNGSSITLDQQGNIYFTGWFMGTADFDPGAGIYNLTSVGYEDAFVCKLDSNGIFLWIKSFSGTQISASSESVSLKVDLTGNVYSTGSYKYTVDFDPGNGVFNLTSIGMDAIFICKLDFAGNFIWAKSFGGPSIDVAYSMALDNNGSIYSAGQVFGVVDFDPGAGIYNVGVASQLSYYLSKLDVNGNLIWAKCVQGADCFSLFVDSKENIYTAGRFSGTVDFDPNAGNYNLTGGGFFVSKFDSLGNLTWARGTNSGVSEAYSIALDSNLNVFISGRFAVTTDFDLGNGVYNLTSLGSWDVFVCELDSSGDFIEANTFGGSHTDQVGSSYFDNNFNLYITGFFSDTINFSPPLISNGNADIFIVKYQNPILEIKENKLLEKLVVFPNPTHGVVNVRFPQVINKSEIIISSLMGEVKSKQTFKNTDVITLTVDGDAGMYLVKVLTDLSQSNFKIVKE